MIKIEIIGPYNEEAIEKRDTIDTRNILLGSYKSNIKPSLSHLLDDLTRTIRNLEENKMVKETTDLILNAKEPLMALTLDDRKQIYSIEKLFEWVKWIKIPEKFDKQTKPHHYYSKINLFFQATTLEERRELLIHILKNIKKEIIITKIHANNKVNKTT